jgi:DNA end-binding protein Ku
MRSIWTGTISFGLVNIPVKVFSMAQEEGLDLDLLHAKDMGRIRYVRQCEKEHKEVPYGEIVRGYAVAKDDYVILTDEDLKNASVQKTQAITIDSFVAATEVDAVYYEKPYALAPAKGGERTYALLREALERSGKVGVATFVFRAHGHVGVIRPFGRALILNQLRFQHQLKDVDDLSLALPKPKEGELKMALSLVRAMTSGFEPAAYKDEYRHELERLIKLKAKGKPIVAAPAPELSATKLDDLVDALTKSLARRAAPTRAAATRRGTRAKKKAPHRRKKSS